MSANDGDEITKVSLTQGRDRADRSVLVQHIRVHYLH
jgi:hypothetical protein